MPHNPDARPPLDEALGLRLGVMAMVRGITANVVNPGPTDTGWMSPNQKREFSERTPLGRTGLPQDAANLVRFLCSEKGGWINGQMLFSNGGFR